MRRVLPDPPPETERERQLAALGRGRRLLPALIATAVMLAVIFPLTFGWDRLPFPGVGPLAPSMVRRVLGQLLLLATVLVLAHRLVGLGNIGMKWRSGGWASLVMMVPILVLSFPDAGPTALPAPSVWIPAVVFAALIGLTEELYGRGLLVTLLGGRRRALFAIVGSALLFAYLHLPPYVESYGWRDALLRCTSSAAFSACFAVMRLRTGSIVGAVVFHAINDAQYLLAGAAAPAAGTANVRPILVGCVLTMVYWLFARRAIREGPPEPRPMGEVEPPRSR